MVFSKKLLLCALFSAVSVLGVVTLFGSSWEISIFQKEILAEHANYGGSRGESSSYGSVTETTEDFVYVSPTLDARIAVPPGDMGVAVTVGRNNTEIAALIKQGYDTQGLNQYLSDLMSVRRRLPDVRDAWCREPGRFLSDLPETSIVIVFYNEAWSVLVRTVHSILDRSPPKLVKEIILVDDFSYLRE